MYGYVYLTDGIHNTAAVLLCVVCLATGALPLGVGPVTECRP